jgi:hypothetical protein
MAKLGNLYISLIADTATFSSGLNKAKGDLNSSAAAMNRVLATVDKQFHGIGETIKDFGSEIFSLKGAFTALVGAVGIGSLVEMGKNAVESVGSLGELASQLGVTTDTLQTFSYAATQVGLSQDELRAGLSKLTKTIGEASIGNKTAIDSFNQFGIKILDAQGNVRSTDAVIRDIADAMKGLSDPAQRAALATELMGKAGQKLIPFLQDGSAGLDDMVQKAKDLGLVFDESTIRAADEAADKLQTLAYVLKTELSGALVQLAPDLTILAQKMIDLALAFDRGANRVAAFFGVINTHNLGAVNEEITGLYDKLHDEEGKLGSIWHNQDTVKKNIDDYKSQLADLIKIRSQLLSQKYAVEHPDASGIPGSGAGVSNPIPKATGETQAQKDQKTAEKMIADLQQQLGDVGKTPIDAKVSDALAKIGQASTEAKTQVADLTREVDRSVLSDADWAKIQQADTEAVQQWTAEMEKGRQVAASLRSPFEVYRDTLAELEQLQRDGAISSATYARGLDQAKASLESTQNQASELGSAMTQLGSTWTSAFEDAALSMDDAGFSAKSLSDAFKGLLQDIERIILRLSVEDPIAKGLGGINWGSLLSGSGTNAAGFRATGAGPSASGNTTASGGGFLSWIGSIFGFHTGGIAGRGGTARGSMPALTFAGAPRLHTGGLIGPGEVPAILKRGEGVFTPEQMASMAPAGGNGGVEVNVINQTGTQANATQTSRTGSDGKQIIDVVLKAVESDIRSNGNVGRAIGQSFGANRVAGAQRS